MTEAKSQIGRAIQSCDDEQQWAEGSRAQPLRILLAEDNLEMLRFLSIGRAA